MNPIAQELKNMADRLRELFPESNHIEFATTRNGISIRLHNIGDYHAATAFMQRIGIGDREKRIHDQSSEAPWSVLDGNADDVKFIVFCTGLPPSCRVETVTKRIPKSEVVETGEFIEVQERVVKCGHGEAVA